MDRTRRSVQTQLQAMGRQTFEAAVFMRAPDKQTLLTRIQAGGAGRPLVNPFAERLVRELVQQTADHPLSGEALEEQVKRIQRESAHMQLLTRSPDEIVAMVDWLKGRNARGFEIFLRPAGSSGLILVDDLTAAAIGRMRRNGVAPAVVIETSPGNHQVWIAVSLGPIREELATAVARDLAVQYGGDPQSAHWRHHGRMTGFTNRKPNRVIQEGPYRGMHPYVLLREARGTLAPAGPALLARAAERLAAEPPRPTLDRGIVRGLLNGTEREPGQEGRLADLYREQAGRLVDRLGNDLSRLDWAVASDLRARGLSPQEVAGAMLAGSPDLAGRKAGHLTDYVERTVAKVFAQPSTPDHRQPRQEAMQRALPREEGTCGR